MTQIIFKTDGFSELETQLSDLAKGFRTDKVLRATIVKAIKTSLEPVAESMEAAAPYDGNRPANKSDQPHLRNTVRIDARIPYDTDRNSSMVNQTDVAIGLVSVKKSAVSLSQEFGNKRTSAQPFIRISLERNYTTVIDKFRSELSQIIPAYAAKLNRRKI